MRDLIVGILFAWSGLGFSQIWRWLARANGPSDRTNGYLLFWAFNFAVFALATQIAAGFAALSLVGLVTMGWWSKGDWGRAALAAGLVGMVFILPIVDNDSLGYTLPMVDNAIKAHTLGPIFTDNPRSITRFWGMESQIGNILELCKGSVAVAETAVLLSLFFVADVMALTLREIKVSPALVRLGWWFCILTLPAFTALSTLKTDIVFGGVGLLLLLEIAKGEDLLTPTGVLACFTALTAKLFYPLLFASLFVFGPWSSARQWGKSLTAVVICFLFVLILHAGRVGGAISQLAHNHEMQPTLVMGALTGAAVEEMRPADTVKIYFHQDLTQSELKSIPTATTPLLPPIAATPSKASPASFRTYHVVFNNIGALLWHQVVYSTASYSKLFTPHNSLFFCMSTGFGPLNLLLFLGVIHLFKTREIRWILPIVSYTCLVDFSVHSALINNYRYLFFLYFVLAAAGFNLLNSFKPSMQKAFSWFIASFLVLGVIGSLCQPFVSGSLAYTLKNGRPPMPFEVDNPNPSLPYITNWHPPQRMLVTELIFSPEFIFTDSSRSQFSDVALSMVKQEKITELGKITHTPNLMIGFNWTMGDQNYPPVFLGGFLPVKTPLPTSIQLLQLHP